MNYFEINSFSTGRLDSKLLERSGDDFFQGAEDFLDAEFCCQARKRHFSSEAF